MLDSLEARLGLSDEQLRLIVIKLPQMLGLDFEEEIAPKLDALSERLGCASDEELAARLLDKPSELLKAGIEVRGSAAAVRLAGSGAKMSVVSTQRGRRGGKPRMDAAKETPDPKEEDPGGSSASTASGEAVGARADTEEDEDTPPFGGVPVFEIGLVAAAAYAYLTGDAPPVA